MIHDLQGDPVHVGDRIAGAFRQADLAVLKTGIITGFGKRGANDTVIVRWDHSSYAPPTGKTSQIEAHLLRFVRI